MAIMAQPWKHPQNGIFYFRREVPEDIRRVIGKREWKVSLKTRHLPEACLRFIGEAQRCEEAFTAARDQLAGISRVLPSAAIKLANRWAKAVLQEWETNPEKVKDFLAVSDTGSDLDYLPASDFVGMDTPVALTEALSGFIRNTLHQLNLPLPVPADPARRALEDALNTLLRSMPKRTALPADYLEWTATTSPRTPAARAALHSSASARSWTTHRAYSR